MKPRLLLFTAALHCFSRHAGALAATFRRVLSPLRSRWRGATAPSGCLDAALCDQPRRRGQGRPCRRGCGAPATAFSPSLSPKPPGTTSPFSTCCLPRAARPKATASTSPAEKSPSRRPMPPDSSTDFSRLGQLAERCGRRIPAVVIEDAPRFGYRGFMLDVSRHFRDKEFVKRQLDSWPATNSTASTGT